MTEKQARKDERKKIIDALKEKRRAAIQFSKMGSIFPMRGAMWKERASALADAIQKIRELP